jgi:pimeloyl-ACP methyl ester carboxylesterase
MADDYVILLDYLKIDKTALVGWSDGANVGLEIAIRHPERLSRLFAYGGTYKAEGCCKAGAENAPTFKAGFARCAADYARMCPTPAGFDAMVAKMSEMWATTPDFTKDQMSGIRVPTVIFAGDHDELIEPAHTEQMAELIPGAKLVIMKDASHFAMWQKPDEFNAPVLEFLAGK